jgi:hypothetical protein
MKLYAWQTDGAHGPLSFFVMAESEEQATEFVRAHIERESAKDPSFASHMRSYDWPTWHELKVYEAGQVVENNND